MFRTELFHTFQSCLSQRGAESSQIGLRVSRAEGDLRITWSRTARAVLSARSAALAITDGVTRRVIHLSRAELGAGQVVYQPVSPEVALRMDIEDRSGRRTTETTSVLGLPLRAGALVVTDQPADSAEVSPPPKAVLKQARLTVPAPPPSALRTIRGAIRVDAHVTADATGAVRSASLVSRGHSAYFAKLALAAARASRLPTGVESAILHYEFSPGGVRVTQR